MTKTRGDVQPDQAPARLLALALRLMSLLHGMPALDKSPNRQ
jgi:hypothetical protein